MALPANVSYGTVTGLFLQAVADTPADQDRAPDGLPATGLSVTFAPSIGPAVVRDTSAAPPATIVVQPVTAGVDASGTLIGADGAPGVTLLATTNPAIDPSGWVWTVTLSSATFPRLSFSFALDGGQTIDLASVVQVPANPGTTLAAWLQAVADAQAARDAAQAAAASVPSAALLAATYSPLGLQAPQKLALNLPTPPRKTLWQTFQAGHGYALINGDPTSNLNDTTDYVLGSQAAKIVTQGTGTAAPLYSFGFTPTLDLTGKQLALLVKVDQPEHLASLELWVGTGTPAPYYAFTATNYISDPSNYLEKGQWVWLVFPWTGMASGTPDRTAISAVQLTANDDNTGQKVAVHVQAIATVPTAVSGAVMFDFDDGFRSQEPAISYLALHGFPCNLYPVGEQIEQGDAGLTSNDQTTTVFLQRAQRLYGAVVGCHATTWALHGTDLGTLTAGDAAAFFASNRKWLTDRGLNGPDFFAYPGGAYSAQALAYARQYTVAARTVDQRQRETLPPGDNHKLRILLASPSLTFTAFQAEVNAAVAGKYLLNVVFHQIDGTNGPALTVFKTLVDYLATQNVPVITAPQALQPAAAPVNPILFDTDGVPYIG